MAMKREMASDGGGGDGDLSLSELLISREIFCMVQSYAACLEKRCHSVVAYNFAKC